MHSGLIWSNVDWINMVFIYAVLSVVIMDYAFLQFLFDSSTVNGPCYGSENSIDSSLKHKSYGLHSPVHLSSS